MAKGKKPKQRRVNRNEIFDNLKLDNINLTKDLYRAAHIIDKLIADNKKLETDKKRLQARLGVTPNEEEE